MENYELNECLGKGCQGSSFLAINKLKQEKCVVKQIECKDESEANLTFHQFLQISSLKHLYICGIKELFITWDKKQCSLFVCTTSDYYEMGDLGKYLANQRDVEKQAINETQIKSWIGEISEALQFILDKGFVHRDLKSKNLYLKEDLNVVVSDFGVATVMEDIREKNRIDKTTLNWMAPETFTRPYDRHSDLWSFGCILLEMVTCSILNSDEMSDVLVQLSTSNSILNSTLEKVKDIYSEQLISLIQNMIVLQPENRSYSNVMESDYVKECLSMTGSALVDRRKRQRITPQEKPIPFDSGIDAVMEYLEAEILNEKCVQEVILWLVSTAHEFHISNQHKIIVAMAMIENLQCEEICTDGLKLFTNFVISANEGDSLYSEPIVMAITKSMQTHSANEKIQHLGATLYMAIATNTYVSTLIGELGGIKTIIDSMIRFKNDRDIFGSTCDALWNLCIVESNILLATKYGALDAVCEGMIIHKSIPEIQENVALCILSLSIEVENIKRASELHIVYYLLSALKTHTAYTKLIKNVCSALGSFAEADEECALHILQCSCPKERTIIQGMPLIVQVYNVHADNVEVVEAIATLVKEVVKYEDIIPVARSVEFTCNLHDMSSKYTHNQIIAVACESALGYLNKGIFVTNP